jgi:pimeloyl-ACP methyl ester carboxylesterase
MLEAGAVGSPKLPRSPDAIIFLPGIMGSTLVDEKGDVVWGMSISLLARQLLLRNALSRIALPRDLKDDGIRASGLLALPVSLPLLTSIEPYSRLMIRLQASATKPSAVLAFPYDWRRSIVEAASALSDVAEKHLLRWTAEWEALPAEDREGMEAPRLTLVAHSMGGLVARWFAEVGGGREIVRQIITLGTPFAGSLKVVRALATGEYLPGGLFANALQATVRSFPGAHELIPQYRCVESLGTDRRRITQADLAGIGVNPDLVDSAFSVHSRLAAAVGDAGDARCAVQPLVGALQPTLQSVTFANGTADFREHVDGVCEGGDGTVYRYSASPRGATPRSLPQMHGSLAKSEEALTYVNFILTDRDLGEVQAPEGVGVRLPELVSPGVGFDIEVLNGDAGTTCRISDAETNEQVGAAVPIRRDGGLWARLTVPERGLYRVTVAGGGYSPVEGLVLADAE